MFAATSSKRAADITPPALVVATGITASFPSDETTVRVVVDVVVDKSVVTFVSLAVFKAIASELADSALIALAVSASTPRATLASSADEEPVPPFEIGSVPITEFDKFTFPLIIS